MIVEKDWIDDFAAVATLEQLRKQKRELVKHKAVVENYEQKLDKINDYILAKLNIKP